MKRALAAGFALIFSLACLCACSATYFTRNDVVFAGLVLDVKLSGGNAQKAYEEMVSLAREVNSAVSLSEPDSVISAFNAAEKETEISVTERVYDLVRLAKEAYNETDGAYNPCLTDVSKAWGVDNEGIKSGESPQSLPTAEQLEALRPTVNPDLIAAREENGNYYISKLADGVKLDLGGIAKGYLDDEFVSIAKKYNVSSGCISLSGNVILLGQNKTGSTERDWGVGVTDPREKNAYVCGFYVPGGVSAVTSGDYERYYESNGVRVCHVIDPFTLMPVGTAREGDTLRQTTDYVISATVVGESSAKCDALATAVMVLGLEKGAEMLARHGYSGLIFTADKRLKIVGEFNFATSQTKYAEYRWV